MMFVFFAFAKKMAFPCFAVLGERRKKVDF